MRNNTMKNCKVQVNLVRRYHPEELVHSFTIEMTPHSHLCSEVNQILWDHGIEADDLENYKIVIELVEAE